MFLSNKRLTIWMFPQMQALHNGVCPWESKVSTSIVAICSNRSTINCFPAKQDTCRAVWFELFRLFGSYPMSNRRFKISIIPHLAEYSSALYRFVTFMFLAILEVRMLFNSTLWQRSMILSRKVLYFNCSLSNVLTSMFANKSFFNLRK